MNNTSVITAVCCNNPRSRGRTRARLLDSVLAYAFRAILLAISISPLLLTATGAHADIDPYRLYLAQRGDIPWQSLSPEEQKALQRYRNQWDGYSGKRQQEMRRGAQRYMELPPQKRREVQQQRRHYQQLTPDERRRLREEYQRQKR